MPYVTEDIKHDLVFNGRPAKNVGELTFVLTWHALQEHTRAGSPFALECLENEIQLYLDGQAAEGYTANYALLCGVVGSLECARREFRRRRPDSYLAADEALSEVLTSFYRHTVAPYEDTKIKQNGDVF